jgi:U3 small nucleolar RNA-associated protein 19
LHRGSRQVIQTSKESDDSQDATQACIEFLTSAEHPPESQNDIQTFLGQEPSRGLKSPLLSVVGHKKQAQEAWLAVLRAGLEKSQRKRVLAAMDRRIVPWFVKVELLMDFLTDSYNVGGSTSLLALSGLFYLIQKRNLDYPSFYQKLYTLLDDSLLHSKHRSMFLRLLDTFMSSTHLPAALVASFIKRLSRLALHAPAAAIVAIVPWIYNMFKKHPTCTFMIHREFRDPSLQREIETEGFEDPFDMEELDPMETGALDSSLWEIETLQSHYHPNVASIAKIISAQFTKQSYNVEDFLDHSYNGVSVIYNTNPSEHWLTISQLIESELNRNLKNTPVVEYEIPKRIFLESDGQFNQLGRLLNQSMEVEQKERGLNGSTGQDAVATA